MALELPRYTLGGFDVALAARRPKGRVLVVYLDRGGQPTDRYREVDSFALRRTGTHLAAINATIAELPAARCAWEPDVDSERLAGRARRRFVDYAIPEGDR